MEATGFVYSFIFSFIKDRIYLKQAFGWVLECFKYEKRECLTLFPVGIFLISFSCFITLANSLNTVSNTNGESVPSLPYFASSDIPLGFYDWYNINYMFFVHKLNYIEI